MIYAALLWILIGGVQAGWSADLSTDLDEASPYVLEPCFKPIEFQVEAFDAAGSVRDPLLLAVGEKSVFILSVSKHGWKNVACVDPAGRALTGGFTDAPAQKGDPIRFFISSMLKDGRVQTTFYVFRKGRSQMEGQTTGRIYRNDGPVLVSQKLAGQAKQPVVVEIPRAGGMPKSLWNLPLPPGTGLFDFARFPDANRGLSIRIEGDEDNIALWEKDQLISRVSIPVGNPYTELPVDLQEKAGGRRASPQILDEGADGTQEIVVAINDPDVGGGFIFSGENHQSRIAILGVTGAGTNTKLAVTGVTPIQKGVIPEIGILDSRVLVALVNTKTHRTQMHWLHPQNSPGGRGGQQAIYSN